MARSLIPGTGSSPTRTPFAEPTSGFRVRFTAFFFVAAFFFAILTPPFNCRW